MCLRSQPTADQFVQSYARCFNNNPQEFKVLNHGDFWSSNIMLSYTQSGEINQLRFVDFQLCKWGSPAQDLWELIICSAKHSIRIECFDSFIRIYHTHLVRCLKTLNFSERLPLLRDLHMSMIKYGFWGRYLRRKIVNLLYQAYLIRRLLHNLYTPGVHPSSRGYRGQSGETHTARRRGRPLPGQGLHEPPLCPSSSQYIALSLQAGHTRLLVLLRFELIFIFVSKNPTEPKIGTEPYLFPTVSHAKVSCPRFDYLKDLSFV